MSITTNCPNCNSDKISPDDNIAIYCLDCKKFMIKHNDKWYNTDNGKEILK